MLDRRAERLWVRLTHEPLRIEEAAAFAARPAAGGIDLFIGTTRGVTDGRRTLRLEYEAHEPMAADVLAALGEEALQRFGLEAVCLLHRTGVVAVGEASVVVGASAAHRAAAFEGCRFLIDRLKQQAPIWKKEYYADGAAEWAPGATPGLW